MKSVLISIKPKYCELIANGKKTVEVRKNRPKIRTPFKCYIYCTLSGSNEAFIAWGKDVAKWNRENWGERKGKVIGEFVCNKLDYVVFGGDSNFLKELSKSSCLSEIEIINYAFSSDKVYKSLSAWHISDLVIYDKPKELSELEKFNDGGNIKIRPCQKGEFCENAYFDYEENTKACDIDYDGENCPYLKLQRPPQSWCYVEGSE